MYFSFDNILIVGDSTDNVGIFYRDDMSLPMHTFNMVVHHVSHCLVDVLGEYVIFVTAVFVQALQSFPRLFGYTVSIQVPVNFTSIDVFDKLLVYDYRT